MMGGSWELVRERETLGPSPVIMSRNLTNIGESDITFISKCLLTTSHVYSLCYYRNLSSQSDWMYDICC